MEENGSNFEEVLNEVVSDLEKLLLKKNNDYGSKNLLTFGNLGILVRMSDKLERLKNYVLGGAELTTDTLEDTLQDIAGYAIMWLTLEKEGYNLDYKEIIKNSRGK